MRVLIVSDSHSQNNFDTILNENEFDMLIHAGDSQVHDEKNLSNIFHYYVKGNCDFLNLPKTLTFTVDNLKVGLTHGHMHDVSYSNYDIINEFEDCDIIIHGHTHVVRFDKIGNKLIVNPGSTRQSRSSYPETYMVLNTNTTNNVTIEVINYKTKEIIDIVEFQL